LLDGLKELIEKSKGTGFILKSDFLAVIPKDMEQDQSDRIEEMLSDMGIELKDKNDFSS